MFTDVFIDFLQFTIPFNKMPFDTKFKRIRPISYYSAGYQGEYGERYYLGTGKSDKPLVVMSGRAVYRWFQIIDQSEFLQKILDDGARVSRIDLTMDCFAGNDLIQPIDYIEWQQNGKIDMRDTWNIPAKTISSWEKFNGEPKQQIETLYFGDWKKRGKRGIVRVYDKGIDLGTYANSVIRLEVEDKRDTAHVSAKRIAEGASVGSVLKTRFNVNDERWQRAIDSESIPTHRGEENDSQADKSTWSWLVNQVAPSLGKQLAYDAINDEFENWQIFNKVVEIEFEKKIKELEKQLDETQAPMKPEKKRGVKMRPKSISES